MDQIPDFVWEALQDPSLRQSEDFLHWLDNDEQHKLLFEELLDIQEAAERQLAEGEPDVQKQWEYVRKRRVRSFFFQSNAFKASVIGIGIAVSIFIFFGVRMYKTEEQPNNTMPTWIVSNIPTPKDAPITVKAIKQTSPIILSNENGKTQAIHKKMLDYTKSDTTHLAVQKFTLTTPRGKSIRLMMSDGTLVWLNAESRLSYPSCFTDTTRTVELEGEAYFKVAPDKACPFIVKHQTGITQALGTEFNIRSYDNETQHVTLVNGSVRISDTSTDQTEILSPGQDAEYDIQSSTMKIKEVNTQKFTAWTEGLFYFENEELRDIMQAIGRWYNITVIFNEEETLHYHFTFWAKRDGSLKETLSLLNQLETVTAYLDITQNKIIIKKQ